MPFAKRVLVITGVPGTGKTSLSEKIAKRIGNAEVVHTTEVVGAKHLFSGVSGCGELIVEMSRLKRELERTIRSSKAGVVIIEGHLLCDIGIRNAVVLVLREHLPVLEERLKQRGYGKGKIAGNIIDEALDYCGVHAGKHYSIVFESFQGDRHLVANVGRLLQGSKLHSSIDLMPELYSMLSSNELAL